MSISFNNIPNTVRTPGAYSEVDNSRALKGLVANPHKVLIIGQKKSTGTADLAKVLAITSENVADGYFGAGSLLSRMCKKFKGVNKNTELFAIALSGGTNAASAVVHFSVALSHAGGSVSAGGGTVRMLVNGKPAQVVLTSMWSVTDINSAYKTLINADVTYGVVASTNATSGLVLSAINSGLAGNYLDARFNYYDGETHPAVFKDSVTVTGFSGGSGDPSLDDVWAVIGNDQYQYIVNPYIEAANLTSLESELADRFKPLEDKWGHGFTGLRATLASCTTLGNSRNSPHNTIIGAYDSPTPPEEWAAVLAGVAAQYLNNDPARPLQFLNLTGILPPPSNNRFTRDERDTLLYDGIATWVVDAGGNVQIERCITTYQTSPLGALDPSYLDIETLATLAEIRYQYKAKMNTQFIAARYKLADDTFPVQAGSYVVTPKTIRQTIISLFTSLYDKGLIEDLDSFKTNLVVERNADDRNRVDVLMPPDVVNQFRVLAGLVQFIL